MQHTQHPKPTVISWDYPTPRGMLDRFVGPGATRTELLLQFIPTTLIALIWPIVAIRGDWGWSILQIVVFMLLSFDLVGGVVTNATSTAKRWYHREGQGFTQHMGFVLTHLHPFLIVWLYAPGNWIFAGITYGYLLLGAVIILSTPLYIRRSVALLLLVGGIFLSIYGVTVPAHFTWFLPLYYTKLFASHLLHEEPYRPATEA